MRAAIMLLPVFLVAAIATPKADDASAPVTLTLKDHHFSPAEVTIAADTRVVFEVTNNDATPAEFESDDFSAEKVLPAGQAAKINVGPLKPGTYEFHDEYNEDESKAKLIVK